MPEHEKENKFQNIIFISIIIIVLFIIVAFGYYYIRKKQNEKMNNSISDIISNEIDENTEIIDTNINGNNEEENNDESEDVKQELVVVETISPTGFSGASNYNLCLYSDKKVYLIIYNGEGYTEKDITSKQLLAENVEDIYYDENAQTMYIVGGNKVSDGGVNWIEFK